MRNSLPKIAVYLLGILYVLGGINHFVNPDFYLPLIPDYFPFHSLLNYASGAGEVLAGIAVLIPSTRKIGCNAILFLLIAFLPAHIYFIQKGGCLSESLCVPVWVAWVRLIVIHPILLYWAYTCRTIK
ncbi:MAG: hypothetical protein K2Q24_18675 [Chitinophagaceae bacterium]|jgi:uncharacterized membrane protein|nr:hypothetical protein [Chitinophagaceae bacterium]